MTASQNDTSATDREGEALSGISPWQLIVVTLLIVAVGIAPSFVMIWPKWTATQSYSHGLLIVVVSAWLLWRQKDRINATETRVLLPMSIILFALVAGSVLAYAASIETVTEALMPITLLAGVLFAAGYKATKIAAFPVLLLYAAVSIWDVINGTLQFWTTAAVTAILSLLRVPAFIDGNFVQIPSGLFEIAGGCSGLHFFIVGVTLAAIYGHLYLHTWSRQIQLVAIMGAMSIAMNWLRVATIIIAGHLTEMQSYLVKVDHYSFGWVLFAIMLLPFFLVARRIERKDAPARKSGGQEFSGAAARASWKPIVLVAAIVLLPVIAWGRLILHSSQAVEITLPPLPGIEGPQVFQGDWQPVFPGAAGEAKGSYIVDRGEIAVYVNWFDGQSQGRELIGYSADLLGRQWIIVNDRVQSHPTRTDHGKNLDIGEIITTTRQGKRRLIQYYYVVGDRIIVNPLETKIRQAVNSLFGRFGSGLVAWSMECGDQDENCNATRDFLTLNISPIEERMLETVEGLNLGAQKPAETLEVKK